MSKASGLKAKRVISCSMIVQLSDHLKRVVFLWSIMEMRNMKKILLFLFVINLCSGCATSGESWKYTSEPKNYVKPISTMTLRVPTLRDERKNRQSQNVMLSLLPLVPYGSITNQVPDGALVKPTEDFSKAITEEIANASIFKDTFYSNSETKGDLFLEGTLYTSKIKDTLTFYGLSLPGDLLWLVGAPTGKATNKITIRYRLMDNNYNVYMDKWYTAKKSRYNFYWKPKGPMFFEKLFKEIALDVVKDLKQVVPTIKKK